MARVAENHEHPSKKHAFHIDCRGKTRPHIFNAPDKSQKKRWISMLEELIESCGMGGNTESSLSSGNSLDEANENSAYEMSEKR